MSSHEYFPWISPKAGRRPYIKQIKKFITYSNEKKKTSLQANVVILCTSQLGLHKRNGAKFIPGQGLSRRPVFGLNLNYILNVRLNFLIDIATYV